MFQIAKIISSDHSCRYF